MTMPPFLTVRHQGLDLQFTAPPAGRYDLTLYVMSSTWIGADLALPYKLNVARAAT